MKKALLFLFISICTLTWAFAKDTNPFNKMNAPEPLKAIKDTLKKPVKSSWQYRIENMLTNSYLWRGLVFNNGYICQPDFLVKKGNWSVMTWSNVVVKETGGNVITPELDMFITYKNKTKNFSYAPALNVFFYPSNYQNIFTMELAGVFKYYAQPVGFYFSPAYDFVSNLGGLYMDYGFYRDDSINSRLSVESKLLMGFGNKKFDEYYNYESGRFPVADASQPSFIQDSKSIRLELQLQYKVSRKFMLKPEVTVFRTFSVGNNYSQAPVRLNTGLTMAYDF